LEKQNHGTTKIVVRFLHFLPDKQCPTIDFGEFRKSFPLRPNASLLISKLSFDVAVKCPLIAASTFAASIPALCFFLKYHSLG
jgi:hypothetical protein